MGTLKETSEFIPVKTYITNAIKVACGAQFSLFLTANGLYGCGYNNKFQLGTVPTIFQPCILEPQKIPKVPTNIHDIQCGATHSLIQTSMILI